MAVVERSSAPGRLAAMLLDRSPPRALELLAVALALLALGALVFGPHVRDGGFYSDDWATAAEYRAASGDGVVAALDRARSGGLFAFRPLLALALPLPHALFGLDARLHLALAIALGVLVSVCLYALLRTLAVERLHAGAVAALVLLFPWSDATRLWATASMNNVAVAAYLVGLVLALRGLRAGGRRGAALHAAAVALYVVSVLTYEVAAVAILASGAVYALVFSWRAARRRWPFEVTAVGAALALVALNTPRELRPPGELVARVATFVGEGLGVLGAAALPGVGGARWAVLVALVAVVSIAAAVALRLTPGDPLRGELTRWLWLAAVGATVIVAGYAMFVPGEDHYSPLEDGLSNRVNLLAAVGHVLIVYSALVLLATLVAALGRARAPQAVAAALAIVAAGALATSYAGVIAAHAAGYARTTAFQGRMLALIEREVRAPRGATIYTFEHPTYIAPGLAGFRHWDLKGAMQVTLDDPTLDAYPIYPGVGWECGTTSLHPRSRFYSREQSLSAYGRAVWVDFAAGRAVVVRDRAQCLALQREFLPGTWS